MKILNKAEDLRNALKEIEPTRIAVAFIGKGWQNYISNEKLKEIIIAPLGSNPVAIKEIMSVLGPNNVYFLDKLHSKFYLGESTALLGSANLSNNGFKDKKQLEVGIVLSDSKDIAKLQSIFEDYKVESLKQYEDEVSKNAKLIELTKEWNLSIQHGLNKEEINESPDIVNYRYGGDQIHIVWYTYCDTDYNKEAIYSAIPESIGIEPEEYFEEPLNFLEDDQVYVGDWILCWNCKENGFPSKKCEISWVYAHCVVPQGDTDEVYTKLVAQIRDKNLPNPPFNLSESTKQIIREALELDKFAKLRDSDGDVWPLAQADPLVPEFIEYIKKMAKRD